MTLPGLGPSPYRSYEQLRLFLIATVIFLLTCVISYTVWDIYREYQNTIRSVEAQSQSYAQALKEHAERTLSELDFILQSIADQTAQSGQLSRLSRERLNEILRRQHSRVSRHVSLAIIDASGRMLASTLSDHGPLPMAEDRPFFQHHRATPSDQSLVSPPFISRLSGTWRFALTRRLSDRSGTFAGVLVAAIDLTYFEQLYKSLATDRNSRFSLATLDGDYLVLVPGAEEIYRSGKKTAPFFRKLTATIPAHTYHNRRSNIAKEYRIVSYHRLDYYPVVAIMSFGRDQSLADWRVTVIRDTVIISVFSLAVILLVNTVLRQFRLFDQRVQERTTQLQLANAFLESEVQERLQAEQQLFEHQKKINRMASELSLSEDHERDRIAGELHDQVGQRLILCKIKLAQLAEQASDNNTYQGVLEIDRLVEQSLQDIRGLTFQLRPPILANAGLRPALEWLGQELQRDYGLEVRFDFYEPVTASRLLKYEIRSTLFQMARELLLNVAKHAGVSLAWVSFQKSEDLLLLRITDNGKGFVTSLATPTPGRKGGFGLFNLKNKLEYLGGTLTVDTAPGNGTCITITLPIRPEMLEGADETKDTAGG